MENVLEMTGQTEYQKPQNVKVNTVRLNGQTGKFIYVDLKNKPEDGRADEHELGTSINVVFLKIRRRLAFFDGGEQRFMQTSEHNSVDDVVTYFPTNERGVASAIREKYPQLRTNQIVYCLFKSPNGVEVVSLLVKGASLGSRAKADTTTDFYSYLGSFNEENPIHEFGTKLSAVKEEGKTGAYYAIDFQKGKRMEDKKIEIVVDHIKEIHERTQSQDAHYSKGAPEVVKQDEEYVPTVEYPEEDINPDDIPF